MPQPLSLAGKRVLVMGLGRFGGGIGVTRFLVSQGAKVLVTDKSPADELAESVSKLAGLPVEFRLGEHRVEDFAAADIVVVNPAVDPVGNIYIEAAKNAGRALTSEIRLLIAQLPNRERTIGITGSAGKSTTTAMLGHMLRELFGEQNVHVGGNLGGSLLGNLDQIKPTDYVVLELSSFMLEGMKNDGWSPHVALITNVAPNHLDRHGTLAEYAAAKRVLFENQTMRDHAIFGPGTLDLMRLPSPRAGFVHQVLAPASDIELLIPGEHNQLNAAFALQIAFALGIPRADAIEPLTTFAGLEHRLQFVCEHAGVRYFNDSKATTPEAALLAMKSFPQGRVHVLLGGYDKKSDLAPMAQFASQHCRAIYTLGVTGPTIADAAERAAQEKETAAARAPHRPTTCGGTGGGDAPPASVIRCDTLDEALKQTTHRIRRGDIVLLSPGCASWDQYENFEKRGHAFVEAILKYTGEDAPSPSN